MTNGRFPKTIASLFIFLFILQAERIFAAADISVFTKNLEVLLEEKHSYSGRLHLKNAIVFSKRSLLNDLKTELLILNEIDKTFSSTYLTILDAIASGKYKSGSVSGPNAFQSLQIANVIGQKISQAEVLYTQNHFFEAKRLAQDVLQIDPTHKKAIELNARITDEIFVKNDDKAFQDLVKQLYDEGVKALRASNYKQAEEKLSKALEMDGDNKQIKKYLEIAADKTRSLKTEASKEKLIETADALRTSGKIKEARKLYEKVMGVDPEEKISNFYINDFNAKSLQNLTKAKDLRATGEIETAFHAIKTSLEFYGENSEALELEKSLSFEMADIKNADLKQKEINKIYNKGVAAYGKGEYTEAIRYWEKVLKLNPTDAQTILNIKKTKLKLEEEKNNIEKEIQKNLDVADMYFNQGFMDKAKAKYEYVQRLDANNAQAMVGLEKVLETTRKVVDEKVSKR